MSSLIFEVRLQGFCCPHGNAAPEEVLVGGPNGATERQRKRHRRRIPNITRNTPLSLLDLASINLLRNEGDSRHCGRECLIEQLRRRCSFQMPGLHDSVDPPAQFMYCFVPGLGRDNELERRVRNELPTPRSEQLRNERAGVNDQPHGSSAEPRLGAGAHAPAWAF